MSAKSILFRIKIIKRIAALTTFSIIAMANNASAVLINFDELNPVYDEYIPCWCDNPLTDQYLSQGLLINGAWANGGNHQVNMLTSNWASLSFIGALPTFFSMNINSVHDDAVLISIYGPNGFITDKQTAGWAGFDEDYIPVIPNEYFSFSAAQGISSIVIQGFYGIRTGAEIDNINYTYSSVPEPSSIALVCIGLFGLFARRIHQSKKYFSKNNTGKKYEAYLYT